MDDASATPPAADSTDSTTTTSDAVTLNQAAAAASDQNGPDAGYIECPTCHNQRRAFTVVDGKCDSCRTKGQSAAIVSQLGWPEVRQRRDVLISRLDWTQLGDVGDDVKSVHAPLRQQLRDITSKGTPLEAWYALDEIEAELAK